jgi:ABC-type uncharacterized transport system substrate-binding protein
MSDEHPFIAMFMNLGEDDREVSARRDAFLEGVNTSAPEAGPVPGLRVALRFGNADFDNYDHIAQELHNLSVDGAPPDLYFTTCWPSLAAVLKLELTAPVVVAGIPEVWPPPKLPSNVYGVISSGKNICHEWVRLLHSIASDVKRVGVIYDKSPDRPDGRFIYNEVAKQADSSGMEPKDFNCGSGTLESEIEHFKNEGTTRAGLIFAMSALTAKRRAIVTGAAQKLTLPAIYPNRLYTFHGGGLASRGTYLPDLYYRAGGYARQLIDYYVRCTSGATLPSPPINRDQAHPGIAKFETVINLNVAADMKLSVPPTVIDTADFVVGQDPKS